MKTSGWMLLVCGPLLAPLLLAVCALFAGLWQDVPEPTHLNEEELGI